MPRRSDFFREFEQNRRQAVCFRMWYPCRASLSWVVSVGVRNPWHVTSEKDRQGRLMLCKLVAGSNSFLIVDILNWITESKQGGIITNSQLLDEVRSPSNLPGQNNYTFHKAILTTDKWTAHALHMLTRNLDRSIDQHPMIDAPLRASMMATT